MKPHPNPLGIVADDALVNILRVAAGSRTLDSVDIQAAGDIRAVVEVWPDRWQHGWEPPNKLRPADLLVIRALASMIDARKYDEHGSRHALDGVGTLARLAIDALPFWIPGQVAAGLARTGIPTEGADTIRLPAETVGVWFGTPIAPPGNIVPEWAQTVTIGPDGNTDVPSDTPAERVAALAIIEPQGFTVDERRLHGAILLADSDGHPVDAMVWIIGTTMIGTGWDYLLIPARPSAGGYRAFWWSMCALSAWGDWVPERTVVVHNRHKMKRLMRAGIDVSKLGPVRVMDARHHRSDGEPKPDPTTTHASPTTHLRRGHWRRQRVGKGRETVEHRWIAPVIVNPGHEGDWRETVWKLPPPESIPDTPVPRKTQRLDV